MSINRNIFRTFANFIRGNRLPRWARDSLGAPDSTEGSMSKRKTHDDAVLPKKEKPAFVFQSLREAMKDETVQVHVDDLCVVILDKYPKARRHWLVIPQEEIPTFEHLNAAHADLLRHLESVGYSVIEKHGLDKKDFRLGYHAIPSMVQLHLHVISQDFVSDKLKTKRHWNSFTTEFFVESAKFIEDIEKNGKFTLLSKEAAMECLVADLKCHKCAFKPSDMPKLKRHLESHLDAS